MSAPPWDGGQPYAGPPQYPTQPPRQYGGLPPAPPPWATPPAWGWTPYPPRPQRPGPVIAAAVLAFASAALVVVGTLYAIALGPLLSLARGPDAGMGPVSALAHLLLAGLLVAGGLRVLGRDRRWLLAAVVGQLVFGVGWVVVLGDVAPASVGSAVLTVPLVFAVPAVVAGGLTFLPTARAWTARVPRPATPPTAGG